MFPNSQHYITNNSLYATEFSIIMLLMIIDSLLLFQTKGSLKSTTFNTNPHTKEIYHVK